MSDRYDDEPVDEVEPEETLAEPGDDADAAEAEEAPQVREDGETDEAEDVAEDEADDDQDIDDQDIDEAQAEIDADLDGDEPADDEPADDEPADDEPGDAQPEEEEAVPAFLAEAPIEPDPDDQPTVVLPAVPAAEETAVDTVEETAIVAPLAEEPAVAAPAEAPEEASGRRVHWGRWVVLLVVLLLAGGYAAAAYYAADRIPAGTTVLGVDLGGLDREQAVAALKPTVDELNSTPVVITAEDREASIDPKDSGLVASAGATVDDLIAFSLSPYDILRSFTGRGVEVDIVTVVHQDALVDAIDGTRDALEIDGQDATVLISQTGASSTPSVDGLGIDPETTAEGLGAAWPVETYPAVTIAKPAAVSTETADAFVSELNSEVLVGDIAMTGPHGDATVTAEQLTRLGSIEAADGTFTYVVDGMTLASELEAVDPGLRSEPTSASFSFTADHQIKTKESTPGQAIDGSALGEAVAAAAYTPERSGVLPYADTEATVTSDDLGVSDFKKKVSSFDTPLTAEPIRTKNLVRGAEMVTGTVVMPDETFSLIEALSPITEANGYYPAHIISGGVLINGIGGGLSQMATTSYNAAYFAGLEDVEHRPHTKWFDRYPAGREATIYVGQLDMRFKNNTPYALVLNSYVENNRLYVDIWSTPYYTVKTYASEKTNFVQPEQIESDRTGCISTVNGNPGFTITNTREVYLDGEQVDKSSYTWTYVPDNGVTCTAS
ncbi:VanW family protein [Demequina subtropica]|uniref:VanW family protein n=1 Tax=Demequina subtropica TaxID=1638989 RepID=UPI0007802A5C|nr:VanW family protein [Demequina subtropica]